MNRNHSELEGLFRSFILLCFSYFFYYLLASGRIKYYINPRFIPFSIFAFIVICIMFIYQFRQTFKTNSTYTCRSNAVTVLLKPGYLIFLIPIFLAVCVPARPLDASVADKKGISIKNTPTINPVKSNKKSNSQISANTSTSIKEDGDNLKSASLIEVTEKNFLVKSGEINLDPGRYLGKKIKVSGFIYTDDTLKQNQFALVRYTISCCTADASITGFLCETSEKLRFSKGAWIEVEGIIKKTSFETEEIAVIEIKKIKKINPPEDPYVYN